MKRRKVRLTVDPIPASYRPAYPSRLEPAELQRLIAPRLRARLHRAALSATLAFGGSACLAREAPAIGQSKPLAAPEDLEARVLAIIRELRGEQGWAAWYDGSSFAPQPAGEEGELPFPAVVARTQIFFGNSSSGVFDMARARRAAADLFAAYGLAPAKDVRLRGEGYEATIDGLDASRGLGYELRGGVPGEELRDVFGGPPLKAETEDAYLDFGEARALRAAGQRIHVADYQAHYDGDQFTPILAYLAGLVDFLNAHTEGPDLDLSAILWQRKQRLYVPMDAEGLDPNEHYPWWESRTISEPETLVLRFNGADRGPIARLVGVSGREERWALKDEPLSTAGAPTAVSHYIHPEYAPEPPAPPLRRLVQPREGGGEIRVETRAQHMFLPSTFDAARPFRIELELQPGRWQIGSYLLVGAPSS